jgi:hypothetical protein
MSSGRKEWMLGIPGHNELVTLDQVLLLVRGGQLRPTDLVKKLGEPWRSANEVSDLAAHFTDTPGGAAVTRPTAEPPIPLKPSETRQGEPIRSTTDRVPRTMGASMGGKTPDSSKSMPKIRAETGTKSSDDKPAEERGPIRSITSRIPPATSSIKEPAKEPAKEPGKASTPPSGAPSPKDEFKAETKRSTVKDRDTDKTDRISARSVAKRDIPKPPPKPQPKIEPMAPKYYSPVDMLRCASFAFEPKKLLFSFPVAVLVTVWFIGMHLGEIRGGAAEALLSVAFTAVLVFGMAILLVGLAFVTRRQLEGRDYYFGEVLNYAVKSLATGLVYPALSLVPSLASVGILFLFKLLRNKSPGAAAALKLGYIFPMLLAIVAVLGALVYQVAIMYVPAAAAVEGEGPWPTISHAWAQVRRQWGRVVLHWLIVTVAFGVISAVFLGLSYFATQLPEIIFGVSEDTTIMESWNQFAGLKEIYRGLAFGLGMLLPISLLSTLGMLSYLSLRLPAGAQLSPSPLDDTSGMAFAARGTRSPNESTNPSDTRPAPAEVGASAAGAGTGPLSDISDDSDEQPLVKD